MVNDATNATADRVQYLGQMIPSALMQRIREANALVAEADQNLARSRHTKGYKAAKREKMRAAAMRERLVGPLRRKQEEMLVRPLVVARSPEVKRRTIANTPISNPSAGRATVAYAGSDAVLTRRTLRELEGKGQLGRIAAALFRAQKASSRAKRYRGGPERRSASYSDLAYDRKGETLKSLCLTLVEDSAGIRWGWGIDERATFAEHVLYVDISAGQVSFHSLDRFEGPDYPETWDGVRDVSAARILLWCDRMLAG